MALQIFVKSLLTSEAETTALIINPEDRIYDLKLLLEQIHGISVSSQVITYGFKQVNDEESLSESGIQDESTLFLSLALLGGGKKRKKKQYTKPKKNKHKKKKVKLAVLKFYKVEANDKVSRLRKECPQDSCGSGVFMAMHHNRTYCGRCGLTYIMKKEENAA